MQTNMIPQGPKKALFALARYETHGGYTWAAVMDDGKTLCVPCVRSNFRRILRATKTKARDGWQIEGLTYCGESESTDATLCAHCNSVIVEALT